MQRLQRVLLKVRESVRGAFVPDEGAVRWWFVRILSVDVGTTNVKAAVVSETLSVARQVNVSLPSESPGPGLHEHSPKALRDAMLRAMRAAVRGVGGVDAIALTSYLFGVMAIDRRGTPLTNMVTWLDERALAVLGEVEGVAAELYLRTGCP
ncbi:MAG TPA: hypothetical protein EYP90_15345, partial [Chromatiaceae bacterium]|nr:hypothetical protein [Chromatiaceae bacterium]